MIELKSASTFMRNHGYDFMSYVEYQAIFRLLTFRKSRKKQNHTEHLFSFTDAFSFSSYTK